MRLLISAMIFTAAGFGYMQYKTAPAGEDGFTGMFVEDENLIDPEIVSETLAEAGNEVVAVAGPQVQDFSEIFRFDLTPNHVMNKWQQVSASLRHLDLQGYRVPLVTGIDDTDLAGSLTYYFDTRQRLRRITFVGTTGNPLRLTHFMTQQYGFRRVVNQDPRRESYAGGPKLGGYYSITPMELIDRDESHSNFSIDLRIDI
ncbi:hypothetical protein CA54_26210 [Symmachiella macrocystis]|uniref:DUF6690 domain-containing protein n=1 Tax=Symmachiella macrocystis TaxID=2527985 RepID=A0A5C6BRD9_9PLAN|nr:DUF6690 family protein [Symmachiella macrocystis]TWU13786.1 hypothetical protein CA54_26210 [Symmachiella macrocystis]